ncbi:MAG: peroxide stress protein YaaA [Marinirhabdus sp.]
MKLVLSPAKSLDFETKPPTARSTQPHFLEQAKTINAKLQRKSKKAIGKLMGLSDKLAQLNYERYKKFETPFTKNNARPAAYAFAGDVYIGLDPHTIPTDKIEILNSTVRILSGMYGLLRPLDLIQPHRLEMGTALKLGRKNNLYEFWGDTITQRLNDTLEENETFVNLASQEYFKAVRTTKLKVPVISPIFKDFKNGELKVISFFAKKARGSMARYVIDHNIKTLHGLKGFDYDGYAHSEKHTQSENEPVFVR